MNLIGKVVEKEKLVGELSPSGSYIKKLVSQRTKYEEQLNSGSEYSSNRNKGVDIPKDVNINEPKKYKGKSLLVFSINCLLLRNSRK